ERKTGATERRPEARMYPGLEEILGCPLGDLRIALDVLDCHLDRHAADTPGAVDQFRHETGCLRSGGIRITTHFRQVGGVSDVERVTGGLFAVATRGCQDRVHVQFGACGATVPAS